MGLYLADAVSMGASLEVRVPMMDHEFVELVSRMPLRYRLSFSRNKRIFRAAMRPHVLESVAKGEITVVAAPDEGAQA